MRHLRPVLLVLLASISCFAEQPNPLTGTATALAYRVIPHERTSYYQAPGYSNTTCFGNGTYFGNSVSTFANCSTVTQAPIYRPVSVVSVEVFNQVDINGLVFTIRCTASWVGSNCNWLRPGDTFPTEVKGTTMWVTARKGGNMGKEVRSKYQILDMRPRPEASQAIP